MNVTRKSVVCVALVLAMGCGAEPVPEASDTGGPPADVAVEAGGAGDVGSPDTAADELSAPDAGPVWPEPPPLADLGAPTLTELPWEWLSFDDGAGVGAVELSEKGVVEYVRFEVFEPVRLGGLRLSAVITSSTTLRATVFDDFGGDSISLALDRTLGTAERAVTPADSGKWLEIPLEPPVVLKPGVTRQHLGIGGTRRDYVGRRGID